MIKKLMLAVLTTVSAMHASAQHTTLVNPILSGFYPDPSIVKAGTDYYLVNSTFSYFPGIPIFHSKDLKNWAQVGNAIHRPSQMDFMGERMTRGLFAPAINYHKGTFYITCTQIDRGGNFIVTAKNPAGPWSDAIRLPRVSGIDPSLLFDDDKLYIVYNSDAPDNKPLYSGHRTIKVFELDLATLKTIGDAKIVVNGGVDISKKPVWIEGPHIIKARGWYYLYAAEGGTSVNHSEVVFRSKSVYGPFVPYEKNPILTQRDLPADRKNPITSTGHADLVEGPDGKTYAIFLAVRPYEENYYNTGRETFIAPVEWIDDWPVINPGFKEVQYSYSTKFQEVKQKYALPQSGNFSYKLKLNKGLDPSMVFLRTLDSTWFSVGKNGLTLKLKPETCFDMGNPAFIGKRQQHLSCTVSTELEFDANADNEKAGLAIFQDEKHFYYLCKSVIAGKPVVQLLKSDGDKKVMVQLAAADIPSSATSVQLQIEAKMDSYIFRYAVQSNKWMVLKERVDAKFLSTEFAGGFIGCVFGLHTTSVGQVSTNTALFSTLTYTGNDPVHTAPALK